MIQTIGLSKKFGEFVAVHDLTLQVPKGLIFGFLGPNGTFALPLAVLFNLYLASSDAQLPSRLCWSSMSRSISFRCVGPREYSKTNAK